MADKFIMMTQQELDETQEAADYLSGDSGVTVDAAMVQAKTEVLIRRIVSGASLLAVAVLTGNTRKTPKGADAPNSNLARRWRVADYLHRAANHDDIKAGLSEAHGLPIGEATKVLQAWRQPMVEAGLLNERGNKAQPLAERAAKAVLSAWNRVKGWDQKGIAATSGAVESIPPFNGTEMFKRAMTGATAEALTAMYVERPAVPVPSASTGPSTPAVVRAPRTGARRAA